MDKQGKNVSDIAVYNESRICDGDNHQSYKSTDTIIVRGQVKLILNPDFQAANYFKVYLLVRLSILQVTPMFIETVLFIPYGIPIILLLTVCPSMPGFFNTFMDK